MRVRYCLIPQGILILFIALFLFPRTEAVVLNNDRDGASPVQNSDGFITVSEDYEFALPDGQEKLSVSRPMEVSLYYVGSELWQGTFLAAGAGNYAYAYPYFGLQVIDMSDPGSPVVVGKYYYPINPEDMVVEGDFVYVASGKKEVLIFDVSDPYAPTMASTIETADYAQGVDIVGTLAYISADDDFLVVDISDPYSPQVLHSFDPGASGARHAVMIGNYAYIAAGRFVQIWNLSDIYSPTFVDRRFLDADSWDIVSSGNTAYVLDRFTGLYLLDVTNPFSPTPLDSWVDTSSILQDVEIAGDYVYVTSSSSIRIIDVSDPNALLFSSSWPALGWNTSTYIDNDRLFISDWEGGASRYNISTPETPALESVYESPGMGYDLAISGNYAFEANGIKGLKVLDISDPESPSVIASYDTPGEAWTVEVIDHYVYLSDVSIGVMIFDVSDPYSPALVDTYVPSSPVRDIAVSGDYAYFGADGLQIFDITVPDAPSLVGYLPLTGATAKLVIDGGYAYQSIYDHGLYIIDIGTPSVPSLTGHYEATACYGVCVVGDYAYLSCGYDRELSVLDISDPANPAFIDAFYFAFHWARHMQQVGDYLYVAAYLEGFKVFNISDPTAPYLTGEYSTSPGWTWDVDVIGDNVWVTCDNGLLSLYRGTCGGPDGVDGFSIGDAVFLIAYIFRGGPSPYPEEAGDVNCDGSVGIDDAIYLINFIFRGGPPPCGGCF